MCFIHRDLVYKKNPHILLLKGPMGLDFGTSHLMAHILDHMDLDFGSHYYDGLYMRQAIFQKFKTEHSN